jgi:hypothetical protein
VLRFRRLLPEIFELDEPRGDGGRVTQETVLELRQRGAVTTWAVISSFTGTPEFHWWLDGRYVGMTRSPEFAHRLDRDQVAELLCRTNYYGADVDMAAIPPNGFPARKLIQWVRSADTDVAYYRVQYATTAGAPTEPDWTTFAQVPDDGRWQFDALTPKLTDLQDYWFGIVPIDTAGNAGTRLTIAKATVVRRPDPPAYAATFDSGTARVTFTSA